MRKTYLKHPIFLTATGLSLITPIHAGTPVWTFSAPNPASITVTHGGTASVEYTVTNQSKKSKNLLLDPNPKKTPPGLSASSCQLAPKGRPGDTCSLTLTINGSAIPKEGIHHGPVLCEQANLNQCYGPGQGNELDVTFSSQPLVTTYTGIYAFTDNFRTTYSIDNGTTWTSMLNQMTGFWYIGVSQGVSAFAVTANNTLYMAMGIAGTAGTLVYSSDGINWAQAGSALPTTNDWVDSVFAASNTVYVGTGNGYVYSTLNNGSSWTQLASPAQLDGAPVNAFVVGSTGMFYAGTNQGNVYFSSDGGASWSPTSYQPDGSAIQSLAVSTNGNVYAVTNNSASASAPFYSSNNGSTSWQLMGTLPSGHANAVSTAGNTVYVGTDNGNIDYTSNNGTSWTTSTTQPDGSKIDYLFVSQNTPLSPLFVASYGVVPVNSGAGSITVKNLSNTTATNVHAQLPSGLTQVTQDASNCTLLPPQATCTLSFSATQPYSPQNVAIVAGNDLEAIYRAALVFSLTPNDGSNYYYVYNVNGTKAYMVDSANASGSPKVWSSDFFDIQGITETDTVSGGSVCNGAIDGACDTTQIVNHYSTPYANYAAGLCYQSTVGGASQGTWYLPSTCELNGGISLNATTNTFESCAPTITGIFSLYSLGALGGSLSSLLSSGNYWSSTEHSVNPQNNAWLQSFAPGGGGGQSLYNKADQLGVRCVQGFTY